MLKAIQSKLGRILSDFLWRFGFAKVLHKDRHIPSFKDDEMLKSVLFENLMHAIELDFAGKAEHIQDISRSVVERMKKTERLSLSDFFNKRMPSMFRDRQITFVIACGIASFWELQVKLLADRLGIEIYEPDNRPKAKSPSIKDIDPIIEDVKIRLPKIDFRFKRLVSLRNALVHGNFHQIRSTASESQRRPVRESYKSNVVMGSFSTPAKAVNLSEITELEEIKKTGLFSWFLDAGNFDLLESVIEEFQSSTELLNAIVSMKSLSFQETAHFFQQVCVEGKALALDDVELLVRTKKNLGHSDDLLRRQVTLIHAALKRDQ